VNGPAAEASRIGVRCHFPTAKVANPSSWRTSARVPALAAMRPRMFGKPVSKFDRARMPTEWWFRPVRRHARVGEHRAVVWKLL
jgi:hypothetical protein